MIEHPFGWFSLLPPIVAIVLAIATRKVVASLFAGVFVGALVIQFGGGTSVDVIGGSSQAISSTFSEHLWSSLISPDKLHVFAFTMLMGVTVGIINRAAGMKGLVNLVSPLAKNRRRGQLTTWFLGLFVFFDDYANTMLLGNTLRPLTDRLKIAREKLAYLVDSTAAPVSGLALISTWVAGEIGYVSDGLSKLPGDLDWNAFSLFVDSIPYRFYVLWALLFVPMIAILGRDFGPMLSAEKRALKEDAIASGTGIAHQDVTAPEESTPARWFNGVVPIVVTVGATIWFLYSSGRESVVADGGSDVSLREYFGNADSYGSLLWGALCGVGASFILILPQRILPFNEMLRAGGNGALKMMPALVILWLASALSSMTGNDANDADGSSQQTADTIASSLFAHDATMPEVVTGMADAGVDARSAAIALAQLASHEEPDESYLLSKDELASAMVAGGYDSEEVDLWMSKIATTPRDESAPDGPATFEAPYPNQGYRLYTGIFLSNLLGDSVKPAFLPTLVFLLASVIAFSTGTSWGTMGIVMPLVIPLVYAGLSAGGETVEPTNPILLASIGGVLAGAIFGDHCSPISDTTVLSSQASSCDHVAHVRTQLPYALTVAAISIVCGTLPIGFGVPVWLTMPAGIGLMLAAILFFGKRAEDD